MLMLMLLAGVVLLAFSSAHANAADPASISGKVTDSAGDPIDSECVQAYDSSGTMKNSVRTNSSGNYRMDGFVTGDYRVEFMGCNYDLAPEFYDDQPTLAQATPVSVTAGANITGINAQLAKGGSISGSVTDTSDNPIYRVCADAYDSAGNFVDFSSTDEGGDYKVDGLATGDYRIKFRNCGGNNVAPEFYDDEQSLAEAMPVSVTASSDTVGVDAQMTTGGTISGTVTNSSIGPLERICVEAYDADGTKVASPRTDSNGNYSVIGLATGDYRLEFRDCSTTRNLLDEFYNDEETLEEATPVSTTAGSDTENIDVELATGGSISGNIDVSGGPSGNVCLAFVKAYDSDGNLAGSQEFFDPRNGYTIDELKTGDYRLSFSYGCVWISPNFIVTPGGAVFEFYFNKETLAEATPVSVTTGSDTPGINALLGRDDDSSISGRVTNSTGDPLEDICVQAFDSDGDKVSSGRSDAGGTYSLLGLDPGSNRLKFSGCEHGENNVIPEFYDDEETLAEATPVSVGQNSNTPGIDAQLATGGIISGTVTGSTGDPLFGICATAYDSTGAEVGSDIALDDGKYRIAGLPTGSYRLNFSKCIDPSGGDFTVTPEFFEDAETLGQATPVSATAGTENSGIDAQLTTQARDTVAPDTSIDAGPSGSIATNEATFEFSSSDPGDTAKFQCKIDSGAFADCASPKTFSSLSEGPHTVAFRAEDAAGNQDQSPATSTFTVDTTVYKAAIGEVSVKGPAKVKRGKKATFTLTVTNTGNAEAAGVGLKVNGRGVTFSTSVGKIPAGSTKTVKIKLKPKKPGKAKLTFRVNSSNAGGKTVKRSITVKE